MRYTAGAALVLSVVLAGCGDDGRSGSSGAADCASMSRFEGQTYVEVGFMRRAKTVIGEAQIAACADVGPDAVGPYFPSNPETAEAWSVEGFDPDRVIALSQGRGEQVRVYASVDLPAAEHESVAREIARQGSRR